MFVVYKGAGEHNMSAEVQRLLGALAALSHLVLHCVHFLHWWVTWIINGRSIDVKIWQVCGHVQKSHTKNNFNSLCSIFCLYFNKNRSQKSLSPCPTGSDAFCQTILWLYVELC